MEDITAVKQVPILEPSTIKIAMCREMSPSLANVMTIAVTAEEDCIMPVKTSPRRNSTRISHVRVDLLFHMEANMFTIASRTSPGVYVRLLTENDIVYNPTKIMPSPARI